MGSIAADISGPVPPHPPSARARLPVAVTVATGFLGGHICDALTDAGHEVRGGLRDPSKDTHLTAQGITLARADLADAGIRRGVPVSTAALYRTRLRRWMDEETAPQG